VDKTDSHDAECCAKLLVTEFNKLPNANPNDKYWSLGNLVSRRDSIVKINVMLKNSLHHLLAEHYPHYKKFFSKLVTKSALGFYEHFPAPYLLESMTADDLHHFMKTNCQGRLSVKKATLILEIVKRNNVEKTEYQGVRDFTVRSLIRQIKGNLAELVALDEQIAKLMLEFDYPLTTMKGIDTLTAAQLINEIGDINRFKSAASLAKFAGVAPFTYASGMSKVELANAKGNRKLNELTFRLALSAISPVGKNKLLLNPILHDYYKKKMSEGKVKNQAIKFVQRRLINILYRMMKDNKPYINPESRYLAS
jgi:transposase